MSEFEQQHSSNLTNKSHVSHSLYVYSAVCFNYVAYKAISVFLLGV